MRRTGRWITSNTGPRRLASAIAAVCLAVLVALHVAAERSRARDGRSEPRAESVRPTVVELDGTSFTCPDHSDAEGLLRLAQRAMEVNDTQAVGRLTALAEALGARAASNTAVAPALGVPETRRPRSAATANHAVGELDQVLEVIPPPDKKQPNGWVPRIVIQEEEEQRLGVEP